MKTFLKLLSLTAAVAAAGSASVFAQTTTYNGNGAGGFGGPIGQGSLTLSSTATTITGTIVIGGNLAFNDDLVIYIDAKAGGYTNTSSLTDTGGGNDRLRQSTSGLASNGNTRAQVNFGSGFGADYAIALSPAAAQFGSFYTLNGNGATANNFTYGSDGTNGNMNLTPTGTNNANGTYTYTFTVPVALLGGATSFNFLTTYTNGADAYRSNETFGNTITDVSNTGNPTVTSGAGAGSENYNSGSDTVLLDNIQTFNIVPEPSTWLGGSLLVVAAALTVARSRRSLA